MASGYDIAYYALLGITAPAWAWRRKIRDKLRDARATRDGAARPRIGSGPAVLVHAVSVGELNAARGLIERLTALRPGLHTIITTTTTAGDELARKLFGNSPSTTVLRFPLDFSTHVARMLDALRPTLVVLMELEVWPNFLMACDRRKIPVVIANGRITEPSFRKYRLLGPLAWSMFGQLMRCIAQDETYAERFAALGVPRDRIEVSGTMKFDTATVGQSVPGADALARDLALNCGQPVWVAGSTGPGEELIVLDVYARLLKTHDTLRLAIIPRKPERFDEVARLIEMRGHACLRRTQLNDEQPFRLSTPVVLGDTMGELRKFYALADVVFVGRSLIDLGAKQHGSDMIEPCALARPTAIGPFTGNFAEPMRAFRNADAIAQVRDADELFAQLDTWLSDTDTARAIGQRAQRVVIAGQGAIDRHTAILLPLLQ